MSKQEDYTVQGDLSFEKRIENVKVFSDTITKDGVTFVDKLEGENSGGENDYYLTFVKYPLRNVPSYQAECGDIMESLNLTINEVNIFKSIWRKAKDRQGFAKSNNTALRDAEKIKYSADRILYLEQKLDEDMKSHD